jgi:crotonobetainyl-CoA:carnitine CoA-transferase CaiB-like acyl-CoA transferase
MARCEALGLPFAPIAKPADLFDDPHLLASGGLLPIELAGLEGAPGGKPSIAVAGLPALPVSLPSGRPGLWRQPPRAGEHGMDIALDAGMNEEEISTLIAEGILAMPNPINATAE